MKKGFVTAGGALTLAYLLVFTAVGVPKPGEILDISNETMPTVTDTYVSTTYTTESMPDVKVELEPLEDDGEITGVPTADDEAPMTTWWRASYGAYPIKTAETSAAQTTTAQTSVTTPSTEKAGVNPSPKTTAKVKVTTASTTAADPYEALLKGGQDIVPVAMTVYDPPATEPETEPVVTAAPVSVARVTAMETQVQPQVLSGGVPAGNGSWGTLTVRSGGSNVDVDGFKVICAVVNTEMGGRFSAEALKAQAVAAYSYFKYNNSKGIYPTVNLNQKISDNVTAAVKAVEGQSAWYNGQIAQTVYCASSGGATASAKDVWGTAVPYLSSVQGTYDSQDPNYGVTKTFTASDVSERVYKTTGIALSGDPSGWFSILSHVDGDYVGNMSIGGQTSFGGEEITGRVFREEIMDFDIRSSKFTIAASGDSISITTYGYGHGVGMSQNGANLFAKEAGWDYRQILQYYYPGIAIS